MLVALGRILQGPPIPIIGGLTLLQLLAMHVPLLLFGTLFAGIVAAFLMLVRPPREAALILILSGIACAAISYLIAAHAMAFLSPLIFLGTPALLATILRLSDSLSLAILCGFVGGEYRGQLLVFDFDAFQRFLHQLRGLGGHGCHPVADVTHFRIEADLVVGGRLGVALAAAGVDDAGQVGVGLDGMDAGQCQGVGGID